MARNKGFDAIVVLDKAVDLFRRQGYNATSPAELVDYLGISRSSLYDTYGDKRSLFIKALQRYREVTTAQLNQIADEATDMNQAVTDVFYLTLNGCLESEKPKGCFLVNSIIELPASEKELVTIVTESMFDHKKALIKIITKGQTSGQFTAVMPAEFLADYLVNALSGIGISAKSGLSRFALEGIIRNSLSILQLSAQSHDTETII